MKINGRDMADGLRSIITGEVQEIRRTPRVALIYAGHDSAIDSFIAIKKRFAHDVGVDMKVIRFPEDVAEERILQEIDLISRSVDDQGKKIYDGLVIQLPLPLHISPERVLDAVPIRMDIDVLSERASATFLERGVFPPVVGAVRHIIKQARINLIDKNILVIGEGRLVGRPIIDWLRASGLVPHVATKDTANTLQLIEQADVIISGAGDPHFIVPHMIKPGVVLIDAGTSEASGKVVGDIDPACAEVAAMYTPVPGGVGPLTVAILFRNLIELIHSKDDDAEMHCEQD